MTSQSAATLRSRYVEQAASDLEENRRRQRELTDRMRLLQQEETLLVEILALAERYEGMSDASPLPDQGQDEPVLGRTQVREAAQVASTRKPRRVAAGVAMRRKAMSSAGSGASRQSRHPLLGDVLVDLLRGHEEPRLAKELRDELLEKHPDRAPTPQVVRNTLESLVAKRRVQRHRQQRSVMYTLVESEGTAAAEATADVH
ncbi:hypothetical protein DI272_38275 [Streptomyces sp. Act143]|uniref:hypothetical protein n=1 Tax=Streptomyces sp. Act143 TaxID=2200760 RepID=UPI000D6748D6|nr:hypothetical protein [Streptomyces sp. Act143]PWI19356.1 hypothetical protein DI272_38275 [Streptomyces sp. Act143]